jgi:polyisoprenoid-binding protein YceI
MKWQIDTGHSQILFSVRHMMLARVRGSFDSFTGDVEFAPDAPDKTSVRINIDSASINTRNDQRDDHLRSADFLDTETHPQLAFQSTRVEALDGERGRLHGDLTIRGVTRPVELDVTYVGQGTSPWGTTVAGFAASTVLKRKDWGLNWNKALETGGVLVGDDIEVQIELELTGEPETTTESSAAQVPAEEPVPALV